MEYSTLIHNHIHSFFSLFSYDVRQYIKCLRNQYLHCGIDPNGISVELYDQLSYLLASGPILQQGYNEYLHSCLGKSMIQQSGELAP